MTILEFLIPERPLSLQAKRSSLSSWKAYVKAEATKAWSGQMVQSGDVHVTLVYLSGLAPPDVDNIIKPIQDSLVGLVFADDALVADVESHRRSLVGAFDLTSLPGLVGAGVVSGKECVYVRVSHSVALEDYL